MFSKGDIVCRLCLFSDFHTSGYYELVPENNFGETPLAMKISCALQWEVSRDDSLPNHVCTDCVQRLDLIIWCNAWSNKIRMCFSQVRSLLESHCSKDKVTGTSTSICMSRSSKVELPVQAIDFSEMKALMSQLDAIFAKCEIAEASSNFPGTDRTEGSPVDKSSQTELSVTNGPGNLDSEETAKQDMTVNDELHQTHSISENSDVEIANDEEYLNYGKDDYSPSKITTHIFLDKNCEAPCNGQFVCPECSETFPRKSNLFKHLMCHEGAPDKYQCSVCRRKFISTSERDTHFRAHMGLKPYRCSKCDKYFSQKNLLDNHINWHEGRKSYLCDICGKYLSSGSNLKTHVLNLHSAVKKKPFQCKVCGNCFSRSHHLENHVTVHEESRPYQCAVCGVTFKRYSQLQEHEYVHSGEKCYTCNECHKAFRTKRVLNVHKLVHSEVKPHKCLFCTKSFVRRGGLLSHLKTHSN